MFAYDEICRIAGKICKAYVHRVFVLEHGFCNGTKSGILVCDYHYFPVVMAYPLQNGNVKMVECIDDKEAWEVFSVLSENGSGNSFVRRIETGMRGYTANMRNFRVAVCNELNDNGVSGDAEDFLMDTYSEVIMEDAMRILTRDHDVSLDEFNKVFGGGEAERTVGSNGFEFKVNDSDLTDEEIRGFAGEVYNLVPSHLKGLCYGVVEVKSGFTHDGTNGDYSASNDMIRMGSRKEKFVGTMLHELGHRWRYKFADPKRISAFRRVFSNANGREISLKEGDVFEFADGRKYEYLGLGRGSRMLVKRFGDEKGWLLLKGISKRSIVRINGEDVDKFQFPTAYSRTDVDEFIAECFELYCLGKLQDQKLKEFVEAQLA